MHATACKDVFASIIALLAEIDFPALGALVARSLNTKNVAISATTSDIMNYNALALFLCETSLGALALSICPVAMRAMFMRDRLLLSEKKCRSRSDSFVPFEWMSLMFTLVVAFFTEVVTRARVTLVSRTFDRRHVAPITIDSGMHDMTHAIWFRRTAFLA